MNTLSNRLLIVDDESGIRDYLSAVSQGLGFEVRAIGNADEFSTAVDEFKPTAMILDLNMPGSDGIELLRYLAEEKSEAQILVISGEDSRVINAAERLGSAQGLQMAGVLQKPVLLAELEAVLSRVMRETITEADLSEAIESGHLLINYQPKLSHNGNGVWSISGAEALVRWRHPELGIIPPDSFIPMAEETGLISPLTDFVLRETMQQNAVWSEHGLGTDIAVNIAPQLLGDVEFPDRLSALLNEYDLDGSKLTLEITETAAMKNVDTMMDIFARLRLKGIKLSIDDFGTGYSSLKQLFCMPFNELKIDRSFVMEIPKSNEAQAMVKTMIQLADNLNMTACAEGVETQEVLDFLELAGCQSIQGFFICEPVAAIEFEKFVRVWNDDSGSALAGIGRT